MNSRLNDLGAEARAINEANGWVTPEDDTVDHQIAVVALIMTEGAEAIEEIRNGEGMEPYYTINGRRVQRATGYYDKADWVAIDAHPAHYDRDTWTGVVPKPEGVPSELADIIIRTLDFAASRGIDIDKAVQEKLAYNRTRSYRHEGKLM